MATELILKGLEEAVEVIANAGKQARFAMVQSINIVAGKVQDAEIDEAKKDFTIRKNWLRKGTKFGINRTFATKENPQAQATVGSSAPWLDLQEFGGTKTQDGHKYSPLMIPVPEIQQTQSRLVPKKLSMSSIKADPTKAKAFQINGNWWYRKDKQTIEPLFIKETSAVIKPRYPFTKVGKELVEESFDDVFTVQFEKAIETAH